MASPESVCFGSLKFDEIQQKEIELRNNNTQMNEKKAVNAFKAYLSEINLDNTDFFTFTEPELEETLSNILVECKDAKR